MKKDENDIKENGKKRQKIEGDDELDYSLTPHQGKLDPQPYTSLMKDRITGPLPSGPNPKLAGTDSASEWEILGRQKSLGANPLILSSFFDLEMPGR